MEKELRLRQFDRKASYQPQMFLNILQTQIDECLDHPEDPDLRDYLVILETWEKRVMDFMVETAADEAGFLVKFVMGEDGVFRICFLAASDQA